MKNLKVFNNVLWINVIFFFLNILKTKIKVIGRLRERVFAKMLGARELRNALISCRPMHIVLIPNQGEHFSVVTHKHL